MKKHTTHFDSCGCVSEQLDKASWKKGFKRGQESMRAGAILVIDECRGPENILDRIRALPILEPEL